MCRSRSTQTVRFDHLTYEEDAIGVTFFKSKTDQFGMERRDPKHVYANPYQPETCVFLALGIYLTCNPTITPEFVFPGVNQRDRFGKALQRLVETINERGRRNICML
ncbi:hypothetical protein Ae201684P_018044 [Aphanomyces euteiches]|uniref:Uncharacterized protein n=1 Tax=Aphanomyces euteiches TaxID=100861 RepID=A0A6G0X3Q7_9STRA|nr:hypothetical protein Ae201684_008883 [Aphanomyces euteiches]KAH9054322.1 hypothetical protein Ae201684P_018044 [Aphanomyces euteiches]